MPDFPLAHDPPQGQPETGKRAREIATRSSYSDQEIEHGLVAVALASGNTRKAHLLLAERGVEIPHQTLHNWLKRHGTEYERIRRDVLPRVKERAAEMHQGLAEAEMEVSRRLLDRLSENIGEISPRDLPGAIRNLDVASAVHTDKARDLRGDPTAIIEQRSLKDVVRALRSKGVKVWEGTAEEVS